MTLASDIDFSPRHKHRALRLLTMLSVIACGASVALAVSLEFALRHDTDLLQEATATKIEGQEETPSDANGDLLAVDDAVVRLNHPWLFVLNALETSTPETVRLLSVEIDATRRQVRLLAQTNTLEAMFGYSQALRREGGFAAAVPQRHEVMPQDGAAGLRFALLLGWSDWTGGTTGSMTSEGLAPNDASMTSERGRVR